jgi:uncharacterized UBP type Zn finger protein
MVAMNIFRRERASASDRAASSGTTPTATCAELGEIGIDPAGDPQPRSGDARACEGCVELGEHHWAHLRMCLTCGHVGCCDSSPRRHATAHFQQTGHPVMRSAEPGEVWRWCYRHEVMG